MKIKKIEIKKLKGIKNLSLSFENEGKPLDIIVLAGSNGTGKTTILEAIKNIFVGDYSDYGNENFPVRMEIFFESLEEVAISKSKMSSKETNIKQWKILNAFRNYSSLKEELEQEFFDYQLAKNLKILPKIIYLPTRTNFQNVNTKTTALKASNHFVNIVDNEIFKDIPSYIAIRVYYVANTQENLTLKEAKEKVAEEINSVFKILDLDIKFIGLSKDEESNPIFSNSAGKEFDINELSSGEKQLFLRTLSIQMLNPKNSIILIDEPEVSLHPEWQQKIIEVYRKIGSNNQIIVATHSPHILGSVRKENIFVLVKDTEGNITVKTGEELYASYGQPTDKILEGIMNLSFARVPEVASKLENLRQLVDNNKYNTEEFKEKSEELHEILGEKDIDLMLIDMDVELKQKENLNAQSE
ncbi:AAA family ATPase [Fusobacterium necrophorum]|uniref:AAA family ATPase n=1 Tax=Fusobacterium necrophorum TaxID=859 RepID=UPI00370E24E8